jgi:hypothetical protein
MQKQLELIDGEFSLEEGLELLSNLLQQKISYHTRKTTAHREMFGTEDPQALLRIQELKEMKAALLDQFKNSDPQLKLQIHGRISLQSIVSQQAS